jgi:superfamily II DNA helicase RecQ
VLALVAGGKAPPVTAGGALRLVATVDDVPAGDPGAEGDPDLVERLRAWRLDAARMRAVPAYVVAHDRTLAAIAEARPRSQADLLRVRGVGHTFVERHGEDVLALVSA